MCGIAGFIQRQPISDDVIERMTAALAHRGPDGFGIWRASRDGWNVALGHRRLSIIDLEGGAQPMHNEDASVFITYNGELYNFHALHPNLERAGHRFATHSDTEVIIHHFEEHGAAGLAALDGMFAFAIWDQNAGQLLLARDRAGIKPLYYATLADGGIAFASELTSLLRHGGIEFDIDPAGLTSYFYQGYIHPPSTVIRGIRKLEPGHLLAWSDGKLSEPQAFWRMGCDARMDPTANYIGTLREELIEAVTSQVVADVPVGVFLSGGIDSSLVAAIAQQHADRPLKTFSIGFDDPQFDESQFARRVARHIGSEHIEQTFDEASLLATMDDALGCLDEPMADPSLLPTYVLSKLAARHVKVALGGDGGDELWAGYPTCKAHRMARAYRRIPRSIRKFAIEPLVRLPATGDGYQSLEWKAKRFALRWSDDPIERHLRWMSVVDLPELPDCLTTATTGGYSTHEQKIGLNAILRLDFETYLSGSVLAKVDRAAMAHGLEVRPPLLANELIDFAFSLPACMKLRGKTSKYLLKQAAQQWLPAEIIYRRKKGFAIPLSQWIRGPLHERLTRVMNDSVLWDGGWLRRETFIGWLKEHDERRVDRSRPLYALFVLDHWLRRLRA